MKVVVVLIVLFGADYNSGRDVQDIYFYNKQDCVTTAEHIMKYSDNQVKAFCADGAILPGATE